MIIRLLIPPSVRSLVPGLAVMVPPPPSAGRPIIPPIPYPLLPQQPSIVPSVLSWCVGADPSQLMQKQEWFSWFLTQSRGFIMVSRFVSLCVGWDVVLFQYCACIFLCLHLFSSCLSLSSNSRVTPWQPARETHHSFPASRYVVLTSPQGTGFAPR